MANDIKQKIVLEGEKEYNAALKEAQRNLKVLRSELKAETAELGKNATEQQKNEVRTKNLQKQIKEQEKMVRAYEKALQEVKEKYGDNEDAVAKWQVKLNDARTALANMRNGLNDMGKDFQKVDNAIAGSATEAKSFADALEKIGDVSSSVSGAIEKAFSGIASNIRDVVGDVWGNLMDIASRANEWGDIATMWGSTPANIQKWFHAIQSEGKEFSKVSSMVTKIITGDQQKIAEATQVSAEQYTDQWDYAMAVMDSLSKKDLEGQLQALSGMGISGAKQEGWIDLLAAWSDIQENTKEFDVTAGGKGITEENLQKADQLAKDVAKIQESWQALTDNWYLELFGDLALNITGNVQNILDAFQEYFNAEDQAGRDEAIKKIEENIMAMFDAISTAITKGIEALNKVADDLLNSDDPTAQTIGGILKKIVGWVEWLGKEENWDKIKTCLEIVFGAWVLAKVMTFANMFASIAANIATITAFKGVGGLLGGAGAAGAGLSSILLPVSLAAITCGPLLYKLIHGPDDADANEAVHTFETIKAALKNGNVNEEATVDVVGDVLNGRRNIIDVISDPLHTMGRNLGTGNGADTVKKGLATLWTGEDQFKDDSYRPEYEEENEYGITNANMNALLLARNNWNNGLDFRAGADNKWKYSNFTLGMIETLSKRYNQEQLTAMLYDMPFMVGLINDRSNYKSSEWEDFFYERGDAFVEEMNKPKYGKRLTKADLGDPVDIPASSWWSNPSGQGTDTTKDEIRGMRQDMDKLPASIMNGISRIRVVMDKEQVGFLVADTVSQAIAQKIGMMSGTIN